MSGLEKAIYFFRSRAELARALGVTGEAVRKWELRERVPIERAVEIARLTDGHVTVHELCPYLPAEIFAKPRKRRKKAA